MINKSEWCWDTAEEGQSLRGEAWSGRVCALKKGPFSTYVNLGRVENLKVVGRTDPLENIFVP